MNRSLLFDKLKKARELLGLTQMQAASASGVKQPHLSDMEKNEKTLIPVRYIDFLYKNDIDLNSLFGAGPVQLRSTHESGLRNPLVENTRLATQDQVDGILERLAQLEAAQKGATSGKNKKAG
ncbi:MAG: helix-turn-helix transcriptional regulator [Bacteroidetes bacterium]|nr:helix-turn-helix transcriptional regulator [Bacteroidota bacterium]